MCGIFGYCGKEPDLGLLASIAEVASKRGPDSFGIAWPCKVDKDRQGFGGWKTTGKPESYMEAVAFTNSAHAVIGHARLATMGEAGKLEEAQPFMLEDMAMVHNGTIQGAKDLAAQFGLSAPSGVDSEILLALAQSKDGHPIDRVAQAINELPPDTKLAALFLCDRELVIARRSLPLWALYRDRAWYFCSSPGDDSGKWILQDDNRLMAFGEGTAMDVRVLAGTVGHSRSW